MNICRDIMLNHLKHLMFNDAIHNHIAGTNHNAMDRSCVYDRFVIEFLEKDFDLCCKEAQEKYQKLREEFTPEPISEGVEYSSWDKHYQVCQLVRLKEDNKVSKDEYRELMADLLNGDGSLYSHQGGYWQSLSELDEYVNCYVTDKMLAFVLSKLSKPMEKPMPLPPSNIPLMNDDDFLDSLRTLI